MRHEIKNVGLMALTVLLYAPTGYPQDDQTATSTESPEQVTDKPAGQEVEVNEDNFRQFMELKDPRQQRGVFPEEAYKSQTGKQKLDKLPEESQKHLRDQLREIIVQGEPWKPGDENSEYPYPPSPAASSNPSLQKQEAEAWGELVGNYHKREAEIHANSARSQAAAAGGGQNSNAEGSGGGSSKQGTESQQSEQQNSAAGSSASGSINDQNVKSTAGVSQNAMEFLNKHTGSGSANTQNASAANGETESQVSKEESQSALDFLNTNTNSNTGSASNDAESSENSPAKDSQSSKQNMVEASQEDAQNALEFLNTSSSTDAESKSAESPADPAGNEHSIEVTQQDAQNALQHLSGELQTSAGADAQQDTLSIDDLQNVQGVTKNNAGSIQPDGDEAPVEKDGSGR